MSIESNPYVFQYWYNLLFLFLKNISIISHLFIFSYLIENGICYLAMADKSYNKRLAFLFLEEISREFVGSLKQEHGEE